MCSILLELPSLVKEIFWAKFEIFGNIWTFLEIFGKYLEKLEIFGKFSEIFAKISPIPRKFSQKSRFACIHSSQFPLLAKSGTGSDIPAALVVTRRHGNCVNGICISVAVGVVVITTVASGPHINVSFALTTMPDITKQ
jgi:hypothetical protein